MEALSPSAAIAGATEDAVSVRLFVTATDRAGAMDQALMIVLAALHTLQIPHDPDSAALLAVGPMAEIERDFPTPE